MRPWRAADAHALAAMCNDDDVARWLPLAVPFTLDDARRWVAGAAGKWRNEKYAAFAVDDALTGELVGSVSVRVDTPRLLGDIGYLVKRERRTHGIAARAVRLLVDWCFDELELGRVQIRCEPDNLASRAVAEACGFVYEGVLRAENVVRDRRVDSAIFSLLRTDPRPGAPGEGPPPRERRPAMRDLAEIVAPPELTDGRLRLRALRPDDKPAVVAGLNDEQAGRFLWRPPFPYSESDFDDFYAISKTLWADERDAHWIVADAGNDAVLASISIDIFELREAGEIGYWCGPWARRRGIMTAAVRMVRDWAFDEIGLERLEIMAHVDNIGSQRVALAAGFQREGVLREYLTARGRRTDNVLFGMVPGDPRPAAGERLPGLGWPRLTDGRVVVRPCEPGDAPAVQAACDDADIAHWIHLVPTPYTIADAEQFVAESRGALAAGKRARLAIVDAKTDELLGSISCDLARDRQAAEIGYWIRREARRHGFAAAAARLVIDWTFRDLGLERLEILTYPGNAASQALAAKLGFTREGVLRGFLAVEPGKSRDGRFVVATGAAAGAAAPARDDQVQFSLLRADWRA